DNIPLRSNRPAHSHSCLVGVTVQRLTKATKRNKVRRGESEMLFANRHREKVHTPLYVFIAYPCGRRLGKTEGHCVSIPGLVRQKTDGILFVKGRLSLGSFLPLPGGFARFFFVTLGQALVPLLPKSGSHEH